MFSRRLPLKVLADWCRSVASSMSAGVPFVKSLKITSRRAPAPIRSVSQRILAELESGADVEEAIGACDDVFPPLFLSLTAVASHTGHLPETLRHLEKYFRFQLQLRRKFLQQIFWPVFQLVAAIFIIALVIFVLGMIDDIQGGNSVDLLGLGLKGPKGAIVWLIGCFGTFGVGYVTYHALRNSLGQAPAVDRWLLKIPKLGPCLKTLALSRTAFAMNLTMDSGMSVLKAVPLSLSAADNGYVESLGPRMVEAIEEGASLHDAFAEHDVFTEEFLEVLATSEVSGSVPEAMGQLSDQLNEEAEHQLALLNTALGWLVWCCVAGIIIFFIFRIFLNYVRLINSFLP
ncbi:MAG: type II secretion system F family protein [Planctomycetota bacterium]